MVNQIHCNGLYDCPVFLLTYLLSSSCSFWNTARRESFTWYTISGNGLCVFPVQSHFSTSSFVVSCQVFSDAYIYIHTHGYASRLWSSPHSPPYLTARAIFQGRKNEIAFVFSYGRAGYVENGGRYGEKTMRCRLLARLCRWR